MTSSVDIDKTPDIDERTEELADRAVDIIREGLQEPAKVRRKIFELICQKLEGDEIKTLVKDVGIKGLKRLLPF